MEAQRQLSYPAGMSPATRLQIILRRYWIIAAVLAVGVAATSGLLALQRRADLQEQYAELQSNAEYQLKPLQAAFSDGLALVSDLQAYMSASGEGRGAQEFADLPGELIERHVGVQEIGWIARVDAADRKAFEASRQNAGFPKFRITERAADGRLTTAGPRDAYFPITVTKPSAGREALLGYDLGSDPERRRAMERARDTGSLVATSPIRLLREAGGQLGLLVFAPVYRHALPEKTIDERRADLAGFVVGVFRIGDMIESVLENMADRYAFDDYFFDGDAPGSGNLIYLHASRLRSAGEAPPPHDRISNTYGWTGRIEIADRQWTVLTVAPPELSSYTPEIDEFGTLFGGIFFTALVSQYLLLGLRRTRALEQEIEARKQLEKHLEIASQIVEQNPVIISRWRVKGETPFMPGNFVPEYISSNVAQLGYTAAEIMSGKVDFFQRVPPEDRPAMVATFRDAVRQNRSDMQSTFRFAKPDGALRWLEGDMVIERDASGRAVRGLGSLRDVTERRQIEERLEFANTLLKTEMDSSPDGILVVDGNGVVISWNRRLAEIHHVSEEAMRTFSAMEASAMAKDPERFHAKVRHLLEHPEESGRDEVEFADGRVFDRYTRSMYDSTGKYLGRVFFMRDVTERRQAEQALAESELRLRTVLDTAVDGILVADAKTRKFLLGNRAICKMLGYSPEELMTRSMENIHPSDAAATARREFERHVVGESHLTAAFPVKRKDGSVFLADIASAPMILAGRPYLVAIFHDVTERKQREIALADATRALGERIKQMSLLVDFSEQRTRYHDAPEPVLAWLAEALPRAWRYPEIAAARVEIDGKTYATAKFHDTALRQRAEIRIGNEVRGSIEVVYLEPCAAGDDGPFSKAEQGLIEELARNIGRFMDRLETQRRLRLANRIVDSSPTILFRADREPGWPLAYISENVSRYGYSAHDMCAAAVKVVAIVHPDDLARVLTELEEAIAADRNEFEIECRLRAADGYYVWLNLKLTTLRDSSGRAVGVEGMGVDVTDRRQAEEKMTEMARHDALTGLANRRVFVEAVQKEIARMQRDSKGFAVLYLDLDHFKDVNDTLGHQVGNLLLQSVAERLKTCVREVDTVARFGGDEFAVLQTDVDDPTDAATLGAKLIDVIGERYSLAGNEIRIGTSIGIDVFGPESRDAETLLSHADVALYQAKSEGRHTYRFFTEAMNAEVKSRVELSSELREAIVSNQLFLVYQPQVEIKNGRIIGVEALVRWRHPRRGVLLPGEFIPGAEKNGLIVPLGNWVLEEACRQAKKWFDAGLPIQITAINVSKVQFTAGINVSSHQFTAQGELEEHLASILRETGLPPGMLELELTEGTLMETSREHNDTLTRIRKSGVRIAIDDFGTGYSSLDYLRTFPVDRVKIAQNFVIDLKADSSDAVIVKASIALARALGLRVIAEGVETAEQLDLLKAWGCPEAQGFYFAKPMPPEALEPLLRAGRIVPQKTERLQRAV
jgi:diguanylate cyclase (GGDEF)-like protein/PAS domain S-box-containing protein